MTTTVIISGRPETFKKAYSVTIKERKVNEQGKVTKDSTQTMSFQIKDITGDSTIEKIKEILIASLK